MPETEKSITQFLEKLKGGDQSAMDELLPIVYEELRRLARSYLNRERADHTLEPTALVHEAYLRLIRQKPIEWENRAHFFGVAARLMREILVEYARARGREKRGGAHQTRVTLDKAVSFGDGSAFDVLILDAALNRMEKLDAKQARVVELGFFGGLTIEETAEVIGVSPATVKREWQIAKCWLLRELRGQTG